MHLTSCAAVLGQTTQAGSQHRLPQSAEPICAIADVCSPQFEVCSSDICPLADAGSYCNDDGEHKTPESLTNSPGVMFLDAPDCICVRVFLNIVTVCPWSNSKLASDACGNWFSHDRPVMHVAIGLVMIGLLYMAYHDGCRRKIRSCRG